MSCRTLVPRRVLPCLCAVLAVTLATAVTASAHEHRELGGFELSVGFLNEPAYVNQMNAIYISVTKPGEDGEEEHEEGEEADDHGGVGVEGLDRTLQVEVTHGGTSKTLDLRPLPGQAGAYIADVVPTAEGAYTFRFFGTIEGMEVNESFTGGPNTFSEVDTLDAIAFPAPVGGNDSTVADDARDTADQARTLALAGLVLGVLGLGAGVAALVTRRPRPAATDDQEEER